MSDRDETRRRGVPRVRTTCEAEHLLLRASDHYGTKGLSTYVVCPGLLYGMGECADGFFRIFKVRQEPGLTDSHLGLCEC